MQLLLQSRIRKGHKAAFWASSLVAQAIKIEHAMGLIETQGLIGAIEATDAASKAAAVVVSSVELTDAAYLTLKIEGDLGAVQAAVEAAVAAVEKIGELVAVHIIPRPDDNLGPILPLRRFVSKYHPDDNRPPLDMDNEEPGYPVKPVPPPFTPSSSNTKKKEPKLKNSYEPKESKHVKKDNLNKMTVKELRQLARSLSKLELRGREISMANKKQLIDAIKSVIDMD